LTARFDGVHVDLGDSALGVVAAVVPWKGSPVKHEVDGRKAHIEVVVEVRKGLVELVADFLALKCVRGSEDGDLSHLGADVNNSRLALEVLGALKVAGNLVGDDGDVGTESIGGESNFHKLEERLLVHVYSNTVTGAMTNLLLFHQLSVGAVIDDVLAEDGSREHGVDLLSVDILELAVQDEVVALSSDIDGGLLSEKNEGEDISVL